MIGALDDGMAMMGVSELCQMVIKRAVIVVAVILDQLQALREADMRVTMPGKQNSGASVPQAEVRGGSLDKSSAEIPRRIAALDLARSALFGD